MSIIAPLERLFESPAKIEQRQRETKAAVRRENENHDGDPPTFRCRVCALQGPDPGYCPTCLADTMVAVKPVPRAT